uniref:Uncharacterized protein n=1 Tax=viral metagenome TaxID=1070528 RepID=A0A6C0BPM7_9ZZZZ
MPPKKKSKRGRSKSPKRCPKGCTKVTKRKKSPKKTKRRKSPKKTKRSTSPKKTKRSKSPKKTKRSKSPKKTTKRAKVMRDTFTMSQLKQINAAGGGISKAGDTKASLARRIAKSPASWAVAAALLVGGVMVARKQQKQWKEPAGLLKLEPKMKPALREGLVAAAAKRGEQKCKDGEYDLYKCTTRLPCFKNNYCYDLSGTMGEHRKR